MALAIRPLLWVNNLMRANVGMLLLVVAGVLFAQAPTGEIAGTVYDASGGVVPDAAIHVKNAATAFERSLATNQSGQYSVPSLAAGTLKCASKWRSGAATDSAKAAEPTRLGVIYYGSTTPAMREALDVLDKNGDHVDAMRLCAFPFPIGASFHCRTRQSVCGGTKPRCANARHAHQRTGNEPRQAGACAALRRHAHHRTLHHSQHSRQLQKETV